MLATELPGYFADIGARLVVTGRVRRRVAGRVFIDQLTKPAPRLWSRQAVRPYTLDIGRDTHGEHFTLDLTEDAPSDFWILNTRRDERHLLLYTAGQAKERFLCGHDERHWFVAAVGEPVSTVMAARRALLPTALRDKGLNKSTLKSRHNNVFKRQGEWFFVPVTDAKLLATLAELPIHRDEPIQRGARNKPHRCDQLVRTGGTTVVLFKGEEFSPAVWEEKMRDPDFRRTVARSEQRTKDMTVYVRGGIRHADHATLVLDGWHQVYLNGEIVSSNVTFYD